MKHVLAATLLLIVACKKSESTPPADPTPAPAPTERGSSSSTGPVGDRRARMLKELDTNGDGVVSDEERAAGHRKRLEGMRARLDTNGDGKLTPDELGAATGRMKFDNPADVDANKDGDISVDELDAAIKARRAARTGGSADDGAPGE